MVEYTEPKDAIRAKLSLRHVAAHYGIVIDESGRALCPFHRDSNPSFEVYTARSGDHERWICFPCRAMNEHDINGGDVFHLIMRQEGVGFGGALERARLMARDTPAFRAIQAQPKPTLDPEMWTEHLIAGRNLALDHPRDLEAAGGFPVGWANTLIHRWGWGLSDDGWALVPHYDRSTHLTGIKLRPPTGGRMASVPGSHFLHLYGAWHSSTDQAVLVCEGETDTIWAAHELSGRAARVYGVPSGAGTPLTSEMMQPLVGKDVWLCFDADPPGRGGAERWAATLLQVARGVNVCRLPEGHDLRSASPGVVSLFGDAERLK